MTLKLKDIDFGIINNLRKDARTPLIFIAKKEGVAVSTVYDRIDRLKKNGILKRFLVSLDFTFLRFPLQKSYFLSLKESVTKKELVFFFSSYEINSIQKIFSKECLCTTSQYFIQAFFKDLIHERQFRKQLKKLFYFKKEYFIDSCLFFEKCRF